MTWTEHHRRGDVLRTVVETLDVHRDGRLPMDLPGVEHAFRDELDLVGALQLVWHQRLTGLIERRLGDPGDTKPPESAVEAAWLEAAEWMPGVRLVLDRHTTHPTTKDMGQALARAAAKERAQLALVAGLASAPDAWAERVGLRIELAARQRWRPGEPLPAETIGARTVPRTPTGSPAFVARLKAVLER